MKLWGLVKKGKEKLTIYSNLKAGDCFIIAGAYKDFVNVMMKCDIGCVYLSSGKYTGIRNGFTTVLLLPKEKVFKKWRVKDVD